MNKKEFQSLVAPLSEKELYYQNHPELSNSFFQTIYPSSEEASVLTLDNSILGDLLLSSHGRLFSKQPVYEPLKTLYSPNRPAFPLSLCTNTLF